MGRRILGTCFAVSSALALSACNDLSETANSSQASDRIVIATDQTSVLSQPVVVQQTPVVASSQVVNTRVVGSPLLGTQVVSGGAISTGTINGKPINTLRQDSFVSSGSNVGHDGDRLITMGIRSLYTFDQDPVGTSTCYNQCAQTWPPYLTTITAQPGRRTSFVLRRDGTRQWAIDGKPLYTYIGDSSANDRKGASIPGWKLGRFTGQ